MPWRWASRRRQDDGGGEDPAPSLAAPDDRALVLLFKVNEAVDVHLPDAPAAPAQGNLLVFRTLTAKLATMGVLMATISMIFTATLMAGRRPAPV